MKLTPLDIHHKEFHRAIRGYNEEEVDNFLDEVAEEFERLFKENIDLKEQIEKVKEKTGQYEELQTTLQNAIITAQRSADEVVTKAKHEAEQILRDAEEKARETLQDAYQGKDKLEANFSDLKQAEADFRSKFRSMLESYLQVIEAEISVPEVGYEPEKAEPKEKAAPTKEAEETSFERTEEATYGLEGETSYEQPESSEDKSEKAGAGGSEEGREDSPSSASAGESPVAEAGSIGFGKVPSEFGATSSEGGINAGVPEYMPGAGLDLEAAGSGGLAPTATATSGPSDETAIGGEARRESYDEARGSESGGFAGTYGLDIKKEEEISFPTLEEKEEEIRRASSVNKSDVDKDDVGKGEEAKGEDRE
ncbi:MAG: DivIVA domain-containing protein [Actinobacteria bacterium]|nr:DivIVA domain-containing protein [Actinomycetota bacterium]